MLQYTTNYTMNLNNSIYEQLDKEVEEVDNPLFKTINAQLSYDVFKKIDNQIYWKLRDQLFWSLYKQVVNGTINTLPNELKEFNL